MPRSLTPPRSLRPRQYRTLVVAFREEQPVGPRIINSRGSITSPGWVAAWSSRCLRFATVLADGPARRASPWGAGPSAAGIAPAPRHELSRRTFFLLCVHGDHGWVGRFGAGRAVRAGLERRIAVGMRDSACHPLAGRLQTEAGRVPQAAPGGGTDGVACCCRAMANWERLRPLRPPPGRRCHPAGGHGSGRLKSARPRRIAARSIPVTSATTAIPARPSASPRRRPPSASSLYSPLTAAQRVRMPAAASTIRYGLVTNSFHIGRSGSFITHRFNSRAFELTMVMGFQSVRACGV